MHEDVGAATRYSWLFTGRKLEEQSEESKVLETFDDADFGVTFAKYCKAHGIKRADGKEIAWRGGMEPGIDYVDAEGNILRLQAIK